MCITEQKRGEKKKTEDSFLGAEKHITAILMQMLFNQKQFCSSLYLITLAIKITF